MSIVSKLRTDIALINSITVSQNNNKLFLNVRLDSIRFEATLNMYY